MFEALKARIRDGAHLALGKGGTAGVGGAVPETKAVAYPGSGGSGGSAQGVPYVGDGVRYLIGGSLPGSCLNWSAMAGDVWRNSAVAVAVGWARRNFPQASPCVREMDGEEIIAGHPLTKLLYRPNPYYSGRTLWAGSLISWIADGNFYWLKVRDQSQRVRELWYLPHFQVTPRLVQGRVLYEHWDGRTRRTYDARDIVHGRNGLDPDNPLRGMSDLKHVLREVATDNECTVYDASLLRNMGIPGVVISPEAGTSIDESGAQTIKIRYQEKFTGDNRGMPLITPMAIKVQNPGFTPEQMALDRIRHVPEARIVGAIGIPAMVLGLSVGQEQKSYANMREAREAAAEEFLIPTYTSIADDVDTQLLGVWDASAGEFGEGAYVPELGDPDAERFDFDTTNLRMLADDVNETSKRWGQLYRDGIAMRSEAREAVGLPNRDEATKPLDGIDDVFYQDGAAAAAPDPDEPTTPTPPTGGTPNE